MGLIQLFTLALTAVAIHGQTTAYYTAAANSGGTTLIGNTPGGGGTPGGIPTTTPTTTPAGGKRVLKPPGCVPKRPKGYAWNPQGALGTWYQYMYGIKNQFLINLTNSFEQDRGIGWMMDTNEQTWIQSVHLSARQDVPPYNCWAAYAYQNITCNGFAITKAYVGGMGFDGIPEFRNFSKIYLEPNFFYIRVYCFDEGSNTFTQDYCETPGVSVWTRKKPIDITPLEDLLIRDILDDRLTPWCMRAEDMLYNQWIDTLPPCPFMGLTQNIRDEWTNAQENQVQKCLNPETDGRCVPASYY